MKVYTIMYEIGDHEQIGLTYAKKNDAVLALENDDYENIVDYKYWRKEVTQLEDQVFAEIVEMEVIGG